MHGQNHIKNGNICSCCVRGR